MKIVIGIIVVLALLAIYFLPSIVGRHKKNAVAIFVLNLFLGLTYLGWVAALIWAVLYEAKEDKKKN